MKLPADPQRDGVASVHFAFDNTYARLPAQFHARIDPVPVAAPRLIELNRALASHLGLNPEELAGPQGLEIFSGNRVAEGSEPVALAYAGHQFGQFVPQLGDGRANLLGEVMALDGRRYDIQLKGSGPTPYSRRGDGRAALGPVLREYLVSESMAALGVPTTRALAAVTTGEPVYRETIQPGAILTRVASSHLRVGTFQFFAARGDTEALRRLADYAIERHDPSAADAARRYRTFLEGVIRRQAQLVAHWMLLGFIHGVMNTDNMSISGETIDYGPCAFMEAFDPRKVFSSIDRQGRYAYSNQPNAAHWNLARLAEALLPLLAEEEGNEAGAVEAATQVLAGFADHYEQTRAAGLRRKLGLLTDHADDLPLAEDLLNLMAAQQADFTLTFHRLTAAAAQPQADADVRSLFQDPAAYAPWAARWRQRLQAEPTSASARAETMRLANPVFIPRNHLVQEAIDAAIEREDFAPWHTLLEACTHPFEPQPHLERLTLATRPEQQVLHTFCGT